MNMFKLKCIGIAMALCFVPLIILLIDAAFKQPKNLRKTATDKHFVVRDPESLVGVGIMGFFITLFLFFVYYVDTGPYNNGSEYLLCVPVFFFWLGIYIIIEVITRKTVILNDQITVYAPLIRVYSFSFSDIAQVKVRGKQYYYVYEEKLTIITKDGKRVSDRNSELQYERLYRLIKQKVPAELLIGFD